MTRSDLPRLLVLCGPTASGKTSLGIELADAVNGEIVGADSLQVYRHIDIGSAKPTAEERTRVPHHVIDVCELDQPFNAAMYKDMADAAIADIKRRGRLPIVVGGTGLYIRILVRGIFEAPKPDLKLRDRLHAELEAYGVEHLYHRLGLVDPVLAEKVEPHDKNRIMRGLEIFEQTGIPLSEHQRVHDFGEASYETLMVGIKRDRRVLYRRIEERTRQMIRSGLLEEYRELRKRGYGPDLKPLLSLGYRQMGEYEVGECTFEEAVADIVKSTKRYAKRQITWFRKVPNLRWFEPDKSDFDALAADVRRFMAGESPLYDWAVPAP